MQRINIRVFAKLLALSPILLLFGCDMIEKSWAPYLFEYSELSDVAMESNWTDSIWQRKDTLKVLCVGTSLTYGADGAHKGKRVPRPWPASFQDLLERDSVTPIKVTNVGRSGAISRDVYLIAVDAMDRETPSIVFVDIGTNEVIADSSLKYYKEYLKALAKDVQSHGAAFVILGSPPIYSKKTRALLEFVRVAREVAIEYDAGFLNLNRKFGQYMDAHDGPKALLPDDVHFGQEGYDIWAQFVYDYIGPDLRND